MMEYITDGKMRHYIGNVRMLALIQSSDFSRRIIVDTVCLIVFFILVDPLKGKRMGCLLIRNPRIVINMEATVVIPVLLGR